MKRNLGKIEEFPDRKITIREVDGTSVGIFRDGEEFSAMLNICPHRAAPLSAGRFIEEDVLECAYHGLCFNAAGQCIRVPSQPEAPSSGQCRAWSVLIAPRRARWMAPYVV